MQNQIPVRGSLITQSLSRKTPKPYFNEFRRMRVSNYDLSDGAHVRGGTSLVLHHAVGLQRVQEASSRTVARTRRKEIQVVAKECGHLEEIQI